MLHPQPDDRGNPVVIKHPTAPTPLGNWYNATQVATCVPGGGMPTELHGIPFTPWDGTGAADGLMPGLVEPAMAVPHGKKAASGVVVVEKDGRAWTVSPTNGFGGYDCTFPKGRVEGGMSLQATAIRECFEESGLRVRITGLLGDFDRTTTRTRYYLAERTGGTPSLMCWESQACTLAPVAALASLLNGKADAPVLAALTAWLASGEK